MTVGAAIGYGCDKRNESSIYKDRTTAQEARREIKDQRKDSNLDGLLIGAAIGAVLFLGNVMQELSRGMYDGEYGKHDPDF